MSQNTISSPFHSLWTRWRQGVKEMRFRGETRLTGVLLFDSGANRSVDGVSIWSLTWEICLSRAFPSSRAYRHSGRHQLVCCYYNSTRVLRLCRDTYIIVVTTALSTEGRLVVELVLEIVLTQVAQGCAHLRMLQLFLCWHVIFTQMNRTHADATKPDAYPTRENVLDVKHVTLGSIIGLVQLFVEPNKK